MREKAQFMNFKIALPGFALSNVILLFLFACRPTTPEITSPIIPPTSTVAPTLITAEVVAMESEMIRISVVDSQETLIGHKHIILLIENISRKEIWFPKDFGIVIKMNRASGGEDIIITNQLNSTYGEEIVLSPFNQGFWKMVTAIEPLLKNTGEEVTLIISVSGFIFDNGMISDEKVEASVEVKYIP